MPSACSRSPTPYSVRTSTALCSTTPARTRASTYSRERLSTMIDSTPWCARICARSSPLGPDPTIATWVRMVGMLSPRRGDHQRAVPSGGSVFTRTCAVQPAGDRRGRHLERWDVARHVPADGARDGAERGDDHPVPIDHWDRNRARAQGHLLHGAGVAVLADVR